MTTIRTRTTHPALSTALLVLLAAGPANAATIEDLKGYPLREAPTVATEASGSSTAASSVFAKQLKAAMDSAGLAETLASTGRGAAAAARSTLETRVGAPVDVRIRPSSGTPMLIEGPLLRGTGGTRRSAGDSENLARTFLRDNRDVLGIEDPDVELVLIRDETDTLGRRHLRFRQAYRGLEVWPSELIVHLDPQGNVDLLNGAYVRSPIGLGIEPEGAAEEALEQARQELGATRRHAATYPQLIVYAPLDGQPRLAWRTEISVSMLAQWLVVVDALDGRILTSFNQVAHADTAGSGTDLFGILWPLQVFKDDGMFALIDASKPMFVPGSTPLAGVIFIADAENRPPPAHLPKTSQILASSADGPWLPDGVSAAVGLSTTYDYYLERHARDSIDGQGGTLKAIVRVGAHLTSAAWFNGFVLFGDGLPFAGAIDIVAHELTHGVIETTANLMYQDQPGALSEAMADIFGENVEAYAYGGEPDWLKGGDIYPAGRQDYLDCGAVEYSPGTPHPSYMSEYLQITADNGGVHGNSCIINFAYFLLADAIGLRDAEQIFYRALTIHLVRNSQFIDARLAAVRSAEELFGVGSSQAQRTAESFDAVEIFDGSGTPAPPSFPPVDAADSLLFLRLIQSEYSVDRREDALGDSVVGFPLSKFPVAGSPPSVSGDGSLAVFLNAKFEVCTINTNAPDNVEEVCKPAPSCGTSHRFQPDSVAIAPDSSRIAVVSNALPEGTGEDASGHGPCVTIIDLVDESEMRIGLGAPVIDGEKSGSVEIARTVEFTRDGRYLIYDAFNRVPQADGSLVGFWSVYAYDMVRKETLALVEANPDMDVMNPSLSQTSDNFLLLDVFDHQSYSVVALDLNTGVMVKITNGGTGPSLPGYFGDDSKVLLTVPDPQASIGVSLAVVELQDDRQTPKGAPVILLRDALLGVVYRRGTFPASTPTPTSLPTLPEPTPTPTPTGPAPTPTLPSSTLTPAGSPTSTPLPTSTGDPTFTPTVSPTQTSTPGRLRADALEVTQGVQDLKNSVRLVAGKRTFVRFHVHSEGGATLGLGTLEVRRGDDMERVFADPPVIRAMPHPDRANLAHSFLFEIPTRFLDAGGNLEITARVGRSLFDILGGNTIDDTLTIPPVSFEEVPSMQLRYYEVTHKAPGVCVGGPDAETLCTEPAQCSSASCSSRLISPAPYHRRRLFSWLERAYPISKLSRSVHAFGTEYTNGAPPLFKDKNGIPIKDTGCMTVNRLLLRQRGRDLLGNPQLRRRTRYYAAVSDSEVGLGFDPSIHDVPPDPVGFFRGCALDIPAFVASGPTGRPAPILNFELRVCVGGTDAGKFCTDGPKQCPGGSCPMRKICVGGQSQGNVCTGDAQCPSGQCRVPTAAVKGSYQWDNDDSYGDFYAGHEIGHTFGLTHLGPKDGGNGAGFCKANVVKQFANPGGSISPVLGCGDPGDAQCGGFCNVGTCRRGASMCECQVVNPPPAAGADAANAVFGFDHAPPPPRIVNTDNAPPTKAVYPPLWKDFMTYCDYQWISDVTTHSLMDRMQGERFCTSAADAGASCTIGPAGNSCAAGVCLEKGLCIGGPNDGEDCTARNLCGAPGECQQKGSCVDNPTRVCTVLTPCPTGECRQPLVVPHACTDYEDAGKFCTDGPTGSTQCKSGECMHERGAGGGIIDRMDRLQVVGTIDTESGGVSLEPLFVLPGAGEIDPRVAGDYAIVLRDATDTVLASYPFTPGEVIQESAPGDSASSTLLFFSELVPYLGGTARVDIDGPTGLLASVSAGMTPPTVEVISPNGGEDLAPDGVVVEWVADDLDGDPLIFDVEYTTDDGATWTAVAMAITDTRVAIDPMNLVGSTQARFRVWATDGIHTSGDESDAVLTVENQPPSAEIVDPMADRAIVAGTTLGLVADVMDDSGSLDGEQVQWRSSLDGAIGSGTYLAVSTLSVGTHTITLVADDGDGGIAQDSVEVVVVSELSELPTPADALQVGPPLLSLGPNTGAATVSIDNANLQRSIGWTATSSEPWVVLEMTQGITPAQVQASLDPQGLEPGEYEASLTFTSPDVPGQSVVIGVNAVIAVVTPSACVGDCDGGASVTVNELITGINIALGNAEISQCPVFDASNDGAITVDELVRGLNNALTGCPA